MEFGVWFPGGGAKEIGKGRSVVRDIYFKGGGGETKKEFNLGIQGGGRGGGDPLFLWEKLGIWGFKLILHFFEGKNLGDLG